MTKVFVISDTHFPFHSTKAYVNMLATIKREKPTHIIQIGDLLDQYAFSKYSKDNKINDVEQGVSQAKVMWAVIRRMLPKAKCYQLMGNHDMRMAKRIQERLPELSSMANWRGMYAFPGVKTLDSDRDFLVIDGVVYVHGWLSKSIDHARYFGKPTVHGHRHRPGIDYDTPRIWSMDVGFLADRASIPLSYTASKHSRWTLACGIVENGKPRLIILE